MPTSYTIAQRIQQPILGVGMALQMSLLVAIIFLMTVQPDLPLALGDVVVALIVGGGLGLLWRVPTSSTGQAASTAQ